MLYSLIQSYIKPIQFNGRAGGLSLKGEMSITGVTQELHVESIELVQVQFALFCSHLFCFEEVVLTELLRFLPESQFFVVFSVRSITCGTRLNWIDNGCNERFWI